jgi:hypothetical protein
MAPQTGTAILVLVVFVLPGFVALRYAELTYRTRADDNGLERVLTALYFSLLSYLVIAAGSRVLLGIDADDVRELWRGQKPLESYLALAVASLVVPLTIAELARRWSRSRARGWLLRTARVSAAHKTPSGWEHFFLQGRWALVRATLKDGRVVGGFFGPDSFAGYTAEIPDLYLERRYVIDPETDWFGEAVTGSLGLYIRAEEIVSVEFYEAGAPEATPSWWHRAWGRIRGHGATSDQEPGVVSAPDSQAGRDLAGRAGTSSPVDGSASAE